MVEIDSGEAVTESDADPVSLVALDDRQRSPEVGRMRGVGDVGPSVRLMRPVGHLRLAAVPRLDPEDETLVRGTDLGCEAVDVEAARVVIMWYDQTLHRLSSPGPPVTGRSLSRSEQFHLHRTKHGPRLPCSLLL